MTVERTTTGMILVSAFVIDGTGNEWLETQRFMDYTKREAVRLFRGHVKENGWKLA